MRLLRRREINLTPDEWFKPRRELHLSDVTYYMEERSNLRRRSLASMVPGRNFMEMGFLWEKLIEIGLRRLHQGARVLHQQQKVVDGIIGTVDGWVPEWRVIEEYKATFTGSEIPGGIMAPKFSEWHVRSRGYCWMFGVNLVRFIVWHIRGDYKSFGPRVVEHVVRYSDRELRENWQMILNNAADAAKARGLQWKR